MAITAANLTVSTDGRRWSYHSLANHATIELVQRLRSQPPKDASWESFLRKATELSIPRPYVAQSSHGVVTADWRTAWFILRIGESSAQEIIEKIFATPNGVVDLTKPGPTPAHYAAFHMIKGAMLSVLRKQCQDDTPEAQS